MSYEPLHHKYRPQTFADLVGQEAIATTLTNAITTERIAPAYLFTGPRGTGKTSSARILAKSLNCLAVNSPTPTPCGQCEVCRAIARGSALDVIEIDAASNTGVDNIREIIERSQFAPVQCRYKVYVIDECHMLSVAAFNALLKTLEEPPEQVIFVLATTDPQRVLPTIISRCQRFDYRRIPLDSMVAHLKKIATQENINIVDEALTLVGQMANGGLRDAESLLDQLSLLAGTITIEKVWDLVGAVPERDLLELLQAIASNNSTSVIDCCRQLMNRGREPLVVLQNLASFYLNLLIAKTAPNRSDLVAVTAATWQDLCQEAKQWELDVILNGQKRLKDSEVQLKNTTQPRLWLEVTLLSLLPSVCRSPQIINPSPSQPSTPTPQTTLPPSSPVAVDLNSPPHPITPSPPHPITPSPPHPITPSPPHPETATPSPQSTNLEQIWQSVLKHLLPFDQSFMRPHCYLISFDETVAYIGLKNANLLQVAKGKLPTLEAGFAAFCGHPVKVNLKVDSSGPTSQSVPLKPSSSPISSNANQQTINPSPPKVVPPEPELPSPKKQPQPPPEPAFIPPSNDFTEISEEDLKKVVDSFANLFEGELVNYGDTWETETSENPLEDVTQTNNIVSPSSPTIITNRPEIPEDEEDLDF